MIRLGVIGTSHIAQQLLDTVTLSGQFCLGAVLSREKSRGEAFAAPYGGAQVFSDMEAFAKEAPVDAVYIAAPNGLHEEQSRVCLSHGKHVLCEKPIVTHPGVYEELYRLAEAKGLIYMEAIMPRHTYARPRVKEAVAAIGPIREAIFDFSQYSSRLDAYLGGERQNIFDLSLWGGCLMDLGIYCAWGAVDLLGAPKSAIATATFLPPGADGEGEATLDYGTFCARLIYRKTRQGAEGSVIRGEQGEVRIAHISQYAGVTLTVGDKTQTLVEVPPRVQVMLGEVEAFARYITQPNATREDYEALYQDTLAVHTLMECLRKSANIPYGKQT